MVGDLDGRDRREFCRLYDILSSPETNTLGALSSNTITLDNTSYTVRALGVLNGKLILSVMPKLTADFVLVVGTDEFASTDASTLEETPSPSSSSSGTTRD